MSGPLVTVRQIELSDAASLLETMTSESVARFVATPPLDLEGFERFIARMRHEQQRGTYACFAVVPAGETTAVGLFQVHALEPSFSTAEWGFALGMAHWGSGMFVEAAALVAGFAFGTLEVSRLEARAAIGNGRGNGALRKLGAVREAILRDAFRCRGEFHDVALWSILAADWRRASARRPLTVGVH